MKQTKHKYLWMAVTADRYEWPIELAKSRKGVKRLCEKAGIRLEKGAAKLIKVKIETGGRGDGAL